MGCRAFVNGDGRLFVRKAPAAEKVDAYYLLIARIPAGVFRFTWIRMPAWITIFRTDSAHERKIRLYIGTGSPVTVSVTMTPVPAAVTAAQQKQNGPPAPHVGYLLLLPIPVYSEGTRLATEDGRLFRKPCRFVIWTSSLLYDACGRAFAHSTDADKRGPPAARRKRSFTGSSPVKTD